MDSGFPYTAPPSFMDFFEGLSQAPLTYANPPPLHHNQESAYWSMNMHSYRFGLSGPGSTSHYGMYGVNDELTRMDFSTRAWEYPSVMNIEEPTAVAMPYEEISAPNMQPIPEESTHPEECVFSNQDADNPQDVWEDEIDLDNMTYEELLDLGETVGSESRGLAQEQIHMLPISKYKSGGLFSRKKSDERCVICQMRYRRGDRQITLPCKHMYHNECGSKWLSINKTCPICNYEVFGEG